MPGQVAEEPRELVGLHELVDEPSGRAPVNGGLAKRFNEWTASVEGSKTVKSYYKS